MGHCFSPCTEEARGGRRITKAQCELESPRRGHQAELWLWRMQLLLEMRHWGWEGGGMLWPLPAALSSLSILSSIDGVQLQVSGADWCSVQGSASQGAEQPRRADNESRVGWKWFKQRITCRDLNGGGGGDYTSIRSSLPAKTFLFPCSPLDAISVCIVEMRPKRHLGGGKT